MAALVGVGSAPVQVSVRFYESDVDWTVLQTEEDPCLGFSFFLIDYPSPNLTHFKLSIIQDATFISIYGPGFSIDDIILFVFRSPSFVIISTNEEFKDEMAGCAMTATYPGFLCRLKRDILPKKGEIESSETAADEILILMMEEESDSESMTSLDPFAVADSPGFVSAYESASSAILTESDKSSDIPGMVVPGADRPSGYLPEMDPYSEIEWERKSRSRAHHHKPGGKKREDGRRKSSRSRSRSRRRKASKWRKKKKVESGGKGKKHQRGSSLLAQSQSRSKLVEQAGLSEPIHDHSEGDKYIKCFVCSETFNTLSEWHTHKNEADHKTRQSTLYYCLKCAKLLAGSAEIIAKHKKSADHLKNTKLYRYCEYCFTRVDSKSWDCHKTTHSHLTRKQSMLEYRLRKKQTQVRCVKSAIKGVSGRIESSTKMSERDRKKVASKKKKKTKKQQKYPRLCNFCDIFLDSRSLWIEHCSAAEHNKQVRIKQSQRKKKRADQ